MASWACTTSVIIRSISRRAWIELPVSHLLVCGTGLQKDNHARPSLPGIEARPGVRLRISTTLPWRRIVSIPSRARRIGIARIPKIPLGAWRWTRWRRGGDIALREILTLLLWILLGGRGGMLGWWRGRWRLKRVSHWIVGIVVSHSTAGFI